MNERDLFRAIGDVDDALLEEAAKQPRRRPQWLRYGLIAACLCAVLLALPAIVSLTLMGPATKGAPELAVKTSAETVPAGMQDTSPAAGDAAESSSFAAMSSPSSVESADGAHASSEPSQSYGDYPADFHFILTWEDFTYDSDGLLTLADGETSSLTLTPEELQQAWKLLSGLELPTDGSGDISLTLTASGQTTSAAVSQEDYGPTLSILTELARLIQESGSWPN